MPLPINPHYHYALVVGIDVYPGLRGNLSRAVGDAEAFHSWLTRDVGVPTDNCRLIVGNTPAIARRLARPIVNEIREELLDLMRLGDAFVDREDYDGWEMTRLYIYVSGHGVAATSIADRALLMANAGPGSWSERVSCTYVRDKLVMHRRAFREVVAFADCCSYLAEETVPSSLILGPDVPVERPVPRYAHGYATIFGRAAFEPAQADALRGYFTQALLDGLRGEAAPAGHPIDASVLANYVERRVPVLTADVRGGPQEPEFQPGSRLEPVVFVPASPGQRCHPVVLRFRNFRGKARIVAHDGRLVSGTSVFDASQSNEWPLQLTQGHYRVLPDADDHADRLPQGGVFSFTGPPPPARGEVHVHEF